jgi:hypothetical protein
MRGIKFGGSSPSSSTVVEDGFVKRTSVNADKMGFLTAIGALDVGAEKEALILVLNEVPEVPVSASAKVTLGMGVVVPVPAWTESWDSANAPVDFWTVSSQRSIWPFAGTKRAIR